MPWFNVDDGFANSKPVLRIPRRYRCPAIGLWTLAGSWSAKELTDGFIPDHAIEEFCSTPAMAELLVNAGLWTKVEGGWQFENWSKYQKTKAQVYAYRAAESERKQRQRSNGKPPAQNDVSGDCPGGTPAGVRVVSQRASDHPLPTPLPTPEGEESPRCSKHLNDPTPPSCWACKRKREQYEEEQAQAADASSREVDLMIIRYAEAARLCPQCDDYGWVLSPDGTPLEPGVKCTDHQESAHA